MRTFIDSWRARRTTAVVVCLATIAACSAPRLTPEQARPMIEAHPRFRAPQTLRVPTRYCALPPPPQPPGVPPTPPPDPGRLHALESARVITMTKAPAAEGADCASRGGQLMLLALTDVSSS